MRSLLFSPLFAWALTLLAKNRCFLSLSETTPSVSEVTGALRIFYRTHKAKPERVVSTHLDTAMEIWHCWYRRLRDCDAISSMRTTHVTSRPLSSDGSERQWDGAPEAIRHWISL